MQIVISTEQVLELNAVEYYKNKMIMAPIALTYSTHPLINQQTPCYKYYNGTISHTNHLTKDKISKLMEEFCKQPELGS